MKAVGFEKALMLLEGLDSEVAVKDFKNLLGASVDTLTMGALIEKYFILDLNKPNKLLVCEMSNAQLMRVYFRNQKIRSSCREAYVKETNKFIDDLMSCFGDAFSLLAVGCDTKTELVVKDYKTFLDGLIAVNTKQKFFTCEAEIPTLERAKEIYQKMCRRDDDDYCNPLAEAFGRCINFLIKDTIARLQMITTVTEADLRFFFIEKYVEEYLTGREYVLSLDDPILYDDRTVSYDGESSFKTMKVGRYIYNSHGADSNYNRLSGEIATIVRVCSESEVDVQECGLMYKCEFENGESIDAFDNELVSF